jgi:hypothetical protein
VWAGVCGRVACVVTCGRVACVVTCGRVACRMRGRGCPPGHRPISAAIGARRGLMAALHSTVFHSVSRSAGIRQEAALYDTLRQEAAPYDWRRGRRGLSAFHTVQRRWRRRYWALNAASNARLVGAMSNTGHSMLLKDNTGHFMLLPSIAHDADQPSHK